MYNNKNEDKKVQIQRFFNFKQLCFHEQVSYVTFCFDIKSHISYTQKISLMYSNTQHKHCCLDINSYCHQIHVMQAWSLSINEFTKCSMYAVHCTFLFPFVTYCKFWIAHKLYFYFELGRDAVLLKAINVHCMMKQFSISFEAV